MRKIYLIGVVLLSLIGLSHAEIPQPRVLLLTAQDNGMEPQDTFTCSGTIHGYLTFPQKVIGKHMLESIWTGPKGVIVQHARNEVNYPSPGRQTTDVWLRFTPEGLLWNPLSVQDAGDADRAVYDGSWKIQVLWDGRTLTQSHFQVHCL